MGANFEATISVPAERSFCCSDGSESESHGGSLPSSSVGLDLTPVAKLSGPRLRVPKSSKNIRFKMTSWAADFTQRVNFAANSDSQTF